MNSNQQNARGPMTALNLSTVREIIRLAEIARNTPHVDDTDSTFEHTPQRQALADKIDALDDDERAELHACVWIGRQDGVHKPADFDDLVRHARTASGGDGSYLASKYELAQYIRNGLGLLGMEATE